MKTPKKPSEVEPLRHCLKCEAPEVRTVKVGEAEFQTDFPEVPAPDEVFHFIDTDGAMLDRKVLQRTGRQTVGRAYAIQGRPLRAGKGRWTMSERRCVVCLVGTVSKPHIGLCDYCDRGPAPPCGSPDGPKSAELAKQNLDWLLTKHVTKEARSLLRGHVTTLDNTIQMYVGLIGKVEKERDELRASVAKWEASSREWLGLNAALQRENDGMRAKLAEAKREQVRITDLLLDRAGQLGKSTDLLLKAEARGRELEIAMRSIVVDVQCARPDVAAIVGKLRAALEKP